MSTTNFQFATFIWAAAALSLLIGVALIGLDIIGPDGTPWRALSTARERSRLKRVTLLLRELEETLVSGVVPGEARWRALLALPAPWGALAHESVAELRKQGGAILPTLRRLRALANEQDSALAEAKSRSAQALGQAFVCIALVPLFSGALYLLLPHVSARAGEWAAYTVGALVIASAGAAWILKLALEARWGGLRGEERSWVLNAQCAGERFLSLLRAGNPPDTAWVRSCEFLATESPRLAEAWGASVWASDEERRRPSRAAEPLWDAGRELKKAVQVSLMEGRPCSERVEASLSGLRLELRVRRERELALLASRALKPLFLCLAPSLFGLLATAILFAWKGGGGSEWF